MPDIAIQVENLGKAYHIGLKEETADTMAGALTSWVRKPLKNFQRLRRLNTFRANGDEDRDDILWALKDVSFDVKRGEVLGVIGRNGAGKSTLLKILSRITEPTKGRATIHGRVSSLLEVGTGFHPELTGRENVYLNGTILGMTKREIDRKFDEIVDFSGVEKFLDTPIKRYSSGMKVRLAFSVAAHLDPEILVIDEVLAVGDVEFQRKCLGKMEDVSHSGRTVLFVSHNLAAVETLCTLVVVLSNGTLLFNGSESEGIGRYLSMVEHLREGVQLSDRTDRRGSGHARFTNVCCLDSHGQPTDQVPCDSAMGLEAHVSLRQQLVRPYCAFIIYNRMNQRVCRLYTNSAFNAQHTHDDSVTYRCAIKNVNLMPGEYHITAHLGESQGGVVDEVENAASVRITASQYSRRSLGTKQDIVFLKSNWTIEPA